MNKKKRRVQLVLLTVGICCFLYPVVSSYVNNLRQVKVVDEYNTVVSEVGDFSDEFRACEEYNQRLLENKDRFVLDDDELKEYNSLLDVSKSGLNNDKMGA